MIRRTRQSRLVTWWRSDTRAARRAAARNAAVDLDIALAPLDPGVDVTKCEWPSRADIAAAVRRGAALTAGTSLLKPPDVERITTEVMTVMCPDNEARARVEAAEGAAWASRPAGEQGDVEAMRRAVAR